MPCGRPSRPRARWSCGRCRRRLSSHLELAPGPVAASSPQRPPEGVAMRRLAPALVLLLGFRASTAHAQLTAGAGVEYFHWREETSPIRVTESGPLFAVALGLAQPGNSPVRVAYQGHGGIGIAAYRGSFLLSPRVAANATTIFATMRHEAQARVRSPGSLEAVGGLAFEWWHRQLSARQQEDYQTVSLAMGLERADLGSAGWSGGGGLRLPLVIRENAHFTDLGY